MSSRRPVAEDAHRNLQFLGCVRPDTGMVVIENKQAFVILIANAARANVAGTEVAIFDVVRKLRLIGSGTFDRFTTPRSILTMSGDDDPFLAQRMPTLLPFDWLLHLADGKLGRVGTQFS